MVDLHPFVDPTISLPASIDGVIAIDNVTGIYFYRLLIVHNSVSEEPSTAALIAKVDLHPFVDPTMSLLASIDGAIAIDTVTGIYLLSFIDCL
jgi:hypothetical protein